MYLAVYGEAHGFTYAGLQRRDHTALVRHASIYTTSISSSTTTSASASALSFVSHKLGLVLDMV